jgi:hypothetical protein
MSFQNPDINSNNDTSTTARNNITSGNSASTSSSSHGGGRLCCGELRQPFFGTTDATGKPLDFTRSLASGQALVIVFKVMTVGLLLATFVHGFITYPHKPRAFRLSYLTIWSLIWAIIYSMSSLYLSISTALFRKQPQEGGGEEQQQQPPYRLTYWTWVWYSVGVNNAIIVTALFWGTEYSPERYPTLDFNSYMDHGGSAILLLVEGLLINRVPIRLKHYFVVLLLAVLYVAWSAIHDVILTVNPARGEDEPLYPVLAWETDMTGAVTISVMVLFVAMPLVQVFVWFLSTLGRRYVISKSSSPSSPPAAGSQAGGGGERDEEAPTMYASTY